MDCALYVLASVFFSFVQGFDFYTEPFIAIEFNLPYKGGVQRRQKLKKNRKDIQEYPNERGG